VKPQTTKQDSRNQVSTARKDSLQSHETC